MVAGAAGGRRIAVPPGRGTRPTSDRVREALFGALDARGAVEGAVVLDMYAGSGALGLEAASRGAVSVVLVEQSWAVAAVARRNAAALGLAAVRVVADRVERYLAGPPADPRVDLALLDPPYDLDDVTLGGVLALLAPWLAAGGLVLVERSIRSPEPTWPAGLAGEGRRRYGETAIWWAEGPRQYTSSARDRSLT